MRQRLESAPAECRRTGRAGVRPRLAAAPLLACLTLATCADGKAAPPIDYALPQSWLARPGLPSQAGQTPSGYTDLQAQAWADVFYIHPTTSLRGDRRNAPIDDREALAIAQRMLRAQASAFNGVARVYAPKYRQLTLSTYALDEAAQQAPNRLAYADVRRAFDYYLEHDNHGRPFFLVGHSQGASHAQRLLSEAIQHTPAQRRLIAAYLPGQPLPQSVFTDDLTAIPPCTQPAQIGCAAVWGVFGEGTAADLRAWEENAYWNAARRRWLSEPGAPMVAINPVSWSASERDTPPERHRGAVPFGVAGTDFGAPRARMLAARCDGRYVYVAPVPLPAALFDDGGVFGADNYHVFDISLFWVDLRENARRRLNAFLRERDRVRHPLLEAGSRIDGRVGKPFGYRIEAQNAPVRFGADGLAPGLALDPASGIISGTPTRPGIYPLVLSAGNASGTDHADRALVIEAAEGGE